MSYSKQSDFVEIFGFKCKKVEDTDRLETCWVYHDSTVEMIVALHEYDDEGTHKSFWSVKLVLKDGSVQHYSSNGYTTVEAAGKDLLNRIQWKKQEWERNIKSIDAFFASIKNKENT